MSGLLERLYPPRLRQRLRPGSELERLLEHADEESARRRGHVEAILAYAADEGWLDHPTRQRLASGDDTVMLAALNELAVARFLGLRGARLQPNPPGRGRHIGEFLVTLSGTSLFLEVKTLVAPLQDTSRSAAERAIADAAGGIEIPAVLEVELQSSPSSGVSIRDLRYYLEQAALQLLAGAHEPPAYIHRSGLTLRVLRAAPLEQVAGQPLQVRFVDWAVSKGPAAEERWRERLLRALRGAYEQLPLPAALSLVAIVDHCAEPGIDLQSLLVALNGSFLRPSQHRRLSAVGYLSALDTLQSGSESLAVVHNPWATRSLAFETLCLPDVVQLCLLRR